MKTNLLIKILILIVIIIIIFITINGSFLIKKYNKVFDQKYISNLDSIPSKIVANSIKSSSSHNSQPWKVKFNDNNNMIELYADSNKFLNIVDSDNKQLLISQGTFIESIYQYSKIYKLDAKIELFDPNFDEKYPQIATIGLTKDDKNLSDIDAISSSSHYTKGNKNTDLFSQIIKNSVSPYSKFEYEIIQSKEDIDKLQDFLLKATIIESSDEKAMKELLSYFRFTEWEKNKKPYGLSLSNLPGILQPFINPIVKASSKNWKSFGEKGITQFKDKLNKHSFYILIKCKSPTNIDYINCGRIYQNLIFNNHGYSIRPAMQVLENFESMKDLNKAFKMEYNSNSEVMMILCLEKVEDAKISNNPRHTLNDLILK